MSSTISFFIPTKSAMDGSDGSPPRYTHGRLQQGPQQPHSQGRSSQPASGFYQQGERKPLLGRHSDAEMESGLSRSPNTIHHISISTFLYLLALLAIFFGGLGYNLNSLMNFKGQERQRHGDEVKKREGISWVGLTAARCSRYATREYTAVLAHVPLGFDALEECRKKPVNIHGRDLLPTRCEDQGACGRVTGHWEVGINEPGCTTWWGRFDKKDCYSSGVQLYHSKLEHLEDDDLWPVMCSTTPRTVNGVHYDGPTSCADFGYGPWGIWHIPDGSCQIV